MPQGSSAIRPTNGLYLLPLAATSAELFSPHFQESPLVLRPFLGLNLNVQLFSKTVFDSRQLKNLDTARDRKGNPQHSCSLFIHPTHNKKQTKN